MSAAGFRIEAARPKNAEVIVKFNVAMAFETEGKRLDANVVRRGVRSVLGHPERGFFLVVRYGRGVVACCLVTFEWSDWRCGNFWWIQSLYVARRFRRRGVFRLLYTYISDKAAEAGDVCGLRLYVDRRNIPAIRAYRRLGMGQTGYRVFEELLGNP